MPNKTNFASFVSENVHLLSYVTFYKLFIYCNYLYVCIQFTNITFKVEEQSKHIQEEVQYQAKINTNNFFRYMPTSDIFFDNVRTDKNKQRRKLNI